MQKPHFSAETPLRLCRKKSRSINHALLNTGTSGLLNNGSFGVKENLTVGLRSFSPRTCGLHVCVSACRRETAQQKLLSWQQLQIGGPQVCPTVNVRPIEPHVILPQPDGCTAARLG